jgi:crotonobetainyl-CoA:carnitine CoA-transferase CaiB-like acyl-CoA transferase
VLEHPVAGPLPVVGNPVRMHNHDTTAQKAPPLLGEDTAVVLHDVLGLGDAEVRRLKERGVV